MSYKKEKLMGIGDWGLGPSTKIKFKFDIN